MTWKGQYIERMYYISQERGHATAHRATGKVLGFGQAAGANKARGNPSPQPLLGCVCGKGKAVNSLRLASLNNSVGFCSKGTWPCYLSLGTS